MMRAGYGGPDGVIGRNAGALVEGPAGDLAGLVCVRTLEGGSMRSVQGAVFGPSDMGIRVGRELMQTHVDRAAADEGVKVVKRGRAAILGVRWQGPPTVVEGGVGYFKVGGLGDETGFFRGGGVPRRVGRIEAQTMVGDRP
jgi:hypothetical protein